MKVYIVSEHDKKAHPAGVVYVLLVTTDPDKAINYYSYLNSEKKKNNRAASFKTMGKPKYNDSEYFYQERNLE